MKVLLLTHSGDFFTVDRVQLALKNLGLYPIRINTDLYPQETQINITIHEGLPKVTIHTAEEIVDIYDVQGVWLRRIWSPQIDKEVEEPFRAMCINESQNVFKGILPLLEHAIWVDPLDKIVFASNKIYQLKLAVTCGLDIPSTLISNESQKVLDFYKAEKNIIAKMTTQTGYGMKSSAMTMATYQVQEEHLDSLESLRYCPMVFQKEIDKAYELRIVYVAGDFFIGAIDASQTQAGQTDWRKTKVDETQWTQAKLPDDIKEKIKRLMTALGLLFGVIDMIKTPEDAYVFLEVNPTGEWGMLERDLHLPISEAIAHTIYQQIQVKLQTPVISSL